jgi:hypothetical protein
VVNNIATITLKFQPDKNSYLGCHSGADEYLSFQNIDDVSIGFVAAESEGIHSSGISRRISE